MRRLQPAALGTPASAGRPGYAGFSRPPWLGLWAIAALALLVRALALAWAARDPAFGIELPGLDAALYQNLARRVAAGDWLLADGAASSPLYAWWLGGLTAVYGEGPWPARVANALVGTGTVWLIGAIAWQVSRERPVAWLAALLAALYLPLILLDTSALKSTLALAWAALGLLLLLRAVTGYRAAAPCWYWPVAGAALALAARLMPQLQPALALLFLWLIFAPARLGLPAGWRGRLVPLALAGLGVALAMAPLWLRTALLPDRTSAPLTGIHLYLGNGPKAWGGYAPVPGIRANPAGHLTDSRRRAGQALGRPVTAAEANRWWLAQTWRRVRDDPAGWARLLAVKLGLAVNRAELPNNLAPDAVRAGAPWLRWLPGAGWVFGPGLAGVLLWLVCRPGPGPALLAVFGLGVLLSLLVGFVTWRYRLGLLLVLLPAAAWLLIRLFAWARVRAWRPLLAGLLLLGAGLGVSLPDRLGPARRAELTQQAAGHQAQLQRLAGLHRALARVPDGPARAGLLRALAAEHQRSADHEGAARLRREAAALARTPPPRRPAPPPD